MWILDLLMGNAPVRLIGLENSSDRLIPSKHIYYKLIFHFGVIVTVNAFTPKRVVGDISRHLF